MNAPIGWDTETALIADGLQAPPLVCMSIADGVDTELVHHTEARRWIEALLSSDRVIVGHNVAFDFGVVAAKWPDLMPAIFDKYERGQVTDTMIRQKLIDIAATSRGFKKYSLEELARRWLRRKLDKDTWRLRYGELHNVPLAWWPKGAKDYAIGDAVTTLDVWVEQESQNKYLEDQFRQTRAAWWLHLMRCWGLRTDPVAVEELATRLQARHDKLFETLVEGGLMRADGTRNVKATAAHMRQVCESKGYALVINKPTESENKKAIREGRKPQGSIKLDKDTCGSTGDSLLEAYAEVSGLKTKLSNFVRLLRKGTSTPLQPYFDSLKETGRTSSSPNVQNLPRKGGVRECFIPRDGNVFAAADYSGFELRTVAQVMLTTGVCKTSKLADALNAGFDPHLEVARRLLGITYDEALERIHEDEVDTARQVGKVGNFGFPGGLGARTFVMYAKKGYGVTITEDEARALKKYWLEAWPEFVRYFEWIGNQCDKGPAQVEQIFVRRYRGGCSYCEAANTMFQGLAADIAKRAGFLIAKACYVDRASPLFGGRPVNFIHDEFIVEVRDDHRAADAAEELARLMVKAAGGFLDDVPAMADPYLMRRWSKKAKPVRVDGRLVPWAA